MSVINDQRRLKAEKAGKKFYIDARGVEISLKSGEPSSRQRAEWGNTAVSAFVNEVGENDDDTDLGDLLCDLMHWADRQGLDYNAISARAERCYSDEVTIDEKAQGCIGEE